MAIILVVVFGVALIAAPIVVAALGGTLGTVVNIILILSGIVTLLVSGTLLVITKLYVKTKASEAFVRTGMGGMQIIKDGGAIVIPVIHQKVMVSLKTIKLVVHRHGGNESLITKDKLRADITAEFFVRVMPKDEDIKAAARSFGEGMQNIEQVKELVEEKLVSALRTVAARETLEALNSERDSFMKQVMEIVTEDLAHNGLTLETPTVSQLDQTNAENLNPQNIFDAQGLATIDRIAQEKLTQRNQLVRDGEVARGRRDVEARKTILTQDQEQAEAEAAQEAEIAKKQAQAEREAREKQIEATRAVAIADVAKQEAIEVATRNQQKAIEVAEREKDQAVAVAEALQANAEAELAKAEALREAEQQQVKTVEVEAEADRRKRVDIISAEAKAQQGLITEQRAADAIAYRMEKEADGKKAAADAEAEAITKRADADMRAAKAEAEGERAKEMVPVDVQAKLVDVEQRRVEVLEQELAAREEHGKIAQDFELAKLEIKQMAEVRIETARAAATMLQKVEMKLFGTPDQVADMNSKLLAGIGATTALEGLLDGVGPQTAELAGTVVDAVANRLAATDDTDDTDDDDDEDTDETPTTTQRVLGAAQTAVDVARTVTRPRRPRPEDNTDDEE